MQIATPLCFSAQYGYRWSTTAENSVCAAVVSSSSGGDSDSLASALDSASPKPPTTTTTTAAAKWQAFVMSVSVLSSPSVSQSRSLSSASGRQFQFKGSAFFTFLFFVFFPSFFLVAFFVLSAFLSFLAKFLLLQLNLPKVVVVVLENRVLPLLLMWRPSTVVDAATTIAGFNLVLALFFLPWQKQQKEH